MTREERQTVIDLEKQGWTVLRAGWPDFFCVRGDGLNTQAMAVEVKCDADDLSQRQTEMQDALGRAGIMTIVVRYAVHPRRRINLNQLQIAPKNFVVPLEYRLELVQRPIRNQGQRRSVEYVVADHRCRRKVEEKVRP